MAGLNLVKLVSLSLLSFLVGHAIAAQSTTVSVLDRGYNELMGSVVAVNSDVTTYAMDCPLSNPTTCGFVSGGPTITAIHGPSTDLIVVSAGVVSYEYACALSSSSIGECTYEGKSGGLYDKTTGRDTTITYTAITITAGLEKLVTSITGMKVFTASLPARCCHR